MKAFIGISLVMLIIVGSWFFLYQSVGKQTEEYVENLNRLLLALEDEQWKTASGQFSQIHDSWKETRDKWTIFLHHHEIDNIDLSMARTTQYIETQNKPLSLAEIEALKQLFYIVRENEALTLTNIL